MNTGQVRSSLSALRWKTDRQLILLLRGEIERSLKLAKRGPGAEAESSYAKSKALLALARASETERAELEAQLNEVRAILDGRRAASSAFSQSAWC